MKQKKDYVFSNGTEFEIWMDMNCDRCVKASRYNEKTDTYTKFRCSVNREIIESYVSDGKASKRTCDICKKMNCPNIQTEYKKYKKRSNNQSKQTTLFDLIV